MATVHPPEADRHGDDPSPRTVERRVGLPSGRAVAGALLITLSAVGVFLAYANAGEDAREPYVVAARDVAAGTTLTAEDLETVALDLAPAQAGRSFSAVEHVIGQVTLDAIGSGELVQASDVSDAPDAGPANELTFQLATSRAVNGDLEPGDLIDVFVTAGGTTRSVVRGVPLLDLPAEVGRGDVVLRVALPGDAELVALVHALNTGDLTVVRTTHAPGGARGPLELDGSAPVVGDDDGDAGEAES